MVNFPRNLVVTLSEFSPYIRINDHKLPIGRIYKAKLEELFEAIRSKEEVDASWND